MAGFVLRNPIQADQMEMPWWCDSQAHLQPYEYLSSCPNFCESSLHELGGLAASLGIARLAVKDETARLGLGSFKSMGGAYAVFRHAQRKASALLNRQVTIQEMFCDQVQDALRGVTVCCASDGNHGRSVAAGARLTGLGCVVFLHKGVPEKRAATIREWGARIVRVEGSYDDSVEQALTASNLKGWTLVADTAQGDGEAALMCGYVMQGYTILVQEIIAQQQGGNPFTHVFIQAGVGGLAAAVIGHWVAVAPKKLPRFIIVEPENHACLLESAKSGRIVKIPDGDPTKMAMLECQRPSEMAWPIVSRLAHTFMTVDDADACDAKSQLRNPIGHDKRIDGGESGTAGLAGLVRARSDERIWSTLELDQNSSVLTLVTETADDSSNQ